MNEFVDRALSVAMTVDALKDPDCPLHGASDAQNRETAHRLDFERWRAQRVSDDQAPSERGDGSGYRASSGIGY